MAPLRANLAIHDDTYALKVRWQAIESRIQRTFFLSWHWISVWLKTVETPVYLLSVQNSDGQDIALGLFAQTQEKRRRVLKFKQLRLHETGNHSKDAVTIEYNTLLCDPGMEAAAWEAAMRALTAPEAPDWDEILIGGATEETLAQINSKDMIIHRRAETTSALVNLSSLRDEGVKDAEGFAATLSKNSRSQLRRSMRLYAERGELALDIAQTEEEALAFMDEMEPHHEGKWRALGKEGAFANSDYLAFQRALIKRSFEGDEKCVELVRARAGEELFGWLYNFIDRNEVLFYLSGFRTEEDNKLKPGLVTHALAVERYLDHGYDVYDFMGGTNRYKTSLGQPGPNLASVSLQRKTAPVLAETAARRVVQKIKGRTS